MKLIFFGNERIATGVTTTAPTLHALVEAGYEIEAVVSNYHAPQSRHARPLEIEEAARALGLPLWLPAKSADILDDIKASGAQAAVLVAYGKIVPQTVIDLFPHGIINIHPSLLPAHRGPIPIESVMLDGSKQTGVSLMQLARKMDAGPVLAQQTLKLSGRESKQELADTLLRLGGELLIDKLPIILDNQITPQIQGEDQATYDKLIDKSDGVLDWSQSAEQLERQIRAYLGWPGSRTQLCDVDVIITAAQAGDSQPMGDSQSTGAEPGTPFKTVTSQLAVTTGRGELIIDKLKPAGKREMSGRDFLSGHQL